MTDQKLINIGNSKSIAYQMWEIRTDLFLDNKNNNIICNADDYDKNFGKVLYPFFRDWVCYGDVFCLKMAGLDE